MEDSARYVFVEGLMPKLLKFAWLHPQKRDAAKIFCNL